MLVRCDGELEGEVLEEAESKMKLDGSGTETSETTRKNVFESVVESKGRTILDDDVFERTQKMGVDGGDGGLGEVLKKVGEERRSEERKVGMSKSSVERRV